RSTARSTIATSSSAITRSAKAARSAPASRAPAAPLRWTRCTAPTRSDLAKNCALRGVDGLPGLVVEQARDVACRHRPPDQIALHFVATGLPEIFELVDGLDALGHDADLELLREP